MNESKAFIEDSNNMISTKALKNKILIKNGKILIAFDDMIANMVNYKKCT